MQLEEIRSKVKLLNVYTFAPKIGLSYRTLLRFRAGLKIEDDNIEKIINGLKDLAQ